MRILRDYPLAKHTTIRIGGAAAYFVTAQTASDVIAALDFARSSSLHLAVLGNGSNVLIGSLPADLLVLRMANRQVNVLGNHIDAQAGAHLPKLARVAHEHELSGLEWGINVPGTVGGAVAMNAGAFDQEMIELLESVEVLDRRGDQRTLLPRDIKAGHRWTSIDLTEYVVLSARLRLAPSNVSWIASQMATYRAYRQRTQPHGLTLGSTFKRHYEPHSARWVSAGSYIDRCQLKGHRIGGAQLSPIHANFVMNQGDATHTDVLALMQHARDLVEQHHGVVLDPEIKLWVEPETLQAFGLR